MGLGALRTLMEVPRSQRSRRNADLQELMTVLLEGPTDTFRGSPWVGQGEGTQCLHLGRWTPLDRPSRP